MKKIISLTLALIMLLSLSSLFSACQKSDEDGDGTTAATTATSDEADSFAGYIVSDLSKLCIIYPSGASDALLSAASMLRDQIEDKLGVRLTVRSDYVNPNVEEFSEWEGEILVGRCANREESESFGAAVRVDDFGYSLIGKKIVICGGDDANTLKAINHFLDNVVKKCDGKQDSVFFSASMKHMTEGSYNMDSLKICGREISEYVLVYPIAASKYEQVQAQRFADLIEAASGYKLRVKSDSELFTKSANEIRFGATDRNAGIIADLALSENGYYIGKDDDGAILMVGKDVNGLLGAVDKIVSMVKSGGREVDIDLADEIKATSNSRELTIMTYNVLCDKVSSVRYQNVISDVLAQMPDSVGFQEVTGADNSGNWMQHLKDGLGEYYECVGEQRGDGGKANRGEYSCIFYRKDLYTLKDSGTKWLSDTPDVISKYDESAYHRIMTWARLERKSDGAEFVHVNTHLAHESDDIAATKQAKVLVDLVSEKFKNIPVLITGDFNTDTGDKPYNEIVKAYIDAKTVAPATESTGTFKNTGIEMDIVFINDMIYAMKYDVIKDRVYQDGVTSDHYPVILKYII